MVFIYEVKMQAQIASFKDYQLKYCQNSGNQQFKLQSWSYFLPYGSVYLRDISPLKNGFLVFLFSFKRIRPPQVRTEPFTIQISEGNVDFSLLMTKLSISPLKLLYERTLSESGAPKTSKLLMSSDFSEMLTSQADGKYPKSKVQKTYFLMSSCLTAQKQLNPFTSFKHSHTYDRNSLEIPMMVKLMPAVLETSSMNAFSCEMLLSQTSVNMMILFQLGHVWLASVQPFSKATDNSNPDRMVVPPQTLILSNRWYISQGNSDLSIGQKMISAESLKVIKLTLSFGLSLEMNILIAYTDNARRDLCVPPYPPSPPPIDPDMSKHITEFKGLSSRSEPSLLPLTKRARQSLISLSPRLSLN